MKKILVLGAGKGQVPIILLSKQKGFETIVASIKGNYPGIPLADKFYEVDIRNKEKVLEIARKENIDGVIADQIDIAVPTAAYVTERLGLPSIGYQTSLKFTNKYLMRDECKRLKINVPEYYNASTLEELYNYYPKLGLPFVIKPTDAAGSKGVSLVRIHEEIEEKFKNALQYSFKKEVILEQYIKGKEYVVEGISGNYTYKNLAFGEREYFDLQDIFIPKKTIFRPYNDENELSILELNEKLINGLELKFGATHGEYLVEEKTNEIYLVEVAARGAGMYISSDLIPLATGVNMNDLLLDMAVGNHLNLDDIDNVQNKISAYICFALPKGKIVNIKGINEIKNHPNVYKAFLENLHLGMEIKEMEDKSSRLGPILVHANDMKEFEKLLMELKDTLKIDVKTSKGVQGIIW